MTDPASLARELRDLAARATELARSLESGLANLDRHEAVMATSDVMPVIDQDELCAMLRIKPRTLRRKVDEGVVPAAFHVGKKPLWRRAEIEAWLAQERTR